MGFNSAFKGLTLLYVPTFMPSLLAPEARYPDIL